jgi:hypothetical protein
LFIEFLPDDRGVPDNFLHNLTPVPFLHGGSVKGPAGDKSALSADLRQNQPHYSS